MERADEADVGVAYDFRTHVEKTLQKDGDVAIDKLVEDILSRSVCKLWG